MQGKSSVLFLVRKNMRNGYMGKRKQFGQKVKYQMAKERIKDKLHRKFKREGERESDLVWSS